MTDIKELWLVVRTDIHGSTFLMKEGIKNEGEASAYIQNILSRQSKPHHQDYTWHNYTPQTRLQRIMDLEIKL